MRDRWMLTINALLGEPMPALPPLPGRVHVCIDGPLSADDLAGITSCAELALILAVSRQAAHQRLQRAMHGAVASSDRTRGAP